MKKSFLGLILLIFLLNSCAIIQKGRGKANAYENYQEDLSGTLITFPDLDEQVAENTPVLSEGEINAVDQDLEAWMENMRENNKKDRYWNGFTVLVYSGVDRDQAFKTRNDLYTHFPDFKTDMQYQQPRYLVKVGKFVNRIEAQAYYYKLKNRFPSARIIQDRFQREGYVNPETVDDAERQNQGIGQRI